MQNLILIPLRPQLPQGTLRGRLIFTFVNYAWTYISSQSFSTVDRPVVNTV